jgi:hypothetical protein
MTDYARIGVSYTVSESSDYSSPAINPPITAYAISGDLEYEWRLVEAHTTAVAVEAGTYTTIHSVIVWNPPTASSGSANPDVCATFTNVGGHVGTAASTSHDIGPGKIAIFTDVNPANDVTLDSESSTTHRVWVGVLGT